MNRQTQENLEHYRQARQQLEQAMTQIEAELGSLKQTHGLMQRDYDRLAAVEVSLQSRGRDSLIEYLY